MDAQSLFEPVDGCVEDVTFGLDLLIELANVIGGLGAAMFCVGMAWLLYAVIRWIAS